MQKVRMNTELRNKLFNKIKNVFENENTQEREAYLQSREYVDEQYTTAHKLAKEVVERAYPPEDVAVLRTFKKKYGSPCDVVAKDKCFYFAHQEGVDEDNDPIETKSHFDFGLFGNLNGSEYSSDEGRKFAFAYYREDLKAMDCNPDIYAQQNENKDNPHKTKHVDECTKALGGSGSTYTSTDDQGMAKTFNEQYYLDVIGTSYCRSRAIACTKDEYSKFEEWRIAKGNLVSKHQTWIDTIQKQCDQLKIGLKAYRYLSEGIELATELGIQVDEAELIRTNSTGLTIYNPSNLASMIKGMKNKHQSREAKILARKKYEESIN
jgi:predicted TIM-barrel fold metal-dependent hydrolase